MIIVYKAEIYSKYCGTPLTSREKKHIIFLHQKYGVFLFDSVLYKSFPILAAGFARCKSITMI